MGHKTQEELLQDLEKARKKIVVGGYYAHYKHPGEKRYQVVDVAIYEATEEICVIYKSLNMEGEIWIRTLENFLSEVEFEGKTVPRFKLL